MLLIPLDAHAYLSCWVVFSLAVCCAVCLVLECTGVSIYLVPRTLQSNLLPVCYFVGLLKWEHDIVHLNEYGFEL
jgi:hypothetical protein